MAPTRADKAGLRSGPPPPPPPHSPPSTSAFAASVFKVAVAQICLTVGHTAAQPSALRAFSDIAARYLQKLASSAASIAAAHGRTNTNILDITRAIEDLRADQGFPGAADPTRPPLSSGALKELMTFVGSVEEIPYPKPIPRRQSTTRDAACRAWTSFEELGRDPPFHHVPRWLPCFPKGGSEVNTKTAEVKRGKDEREERTGALTAAAEGDGGMKIEKKRLLMLPADRRRVKFGLRIGEKVSKCGGGGVGGDEKRKRMMTAYY